MDPAKWDGAWFWAVQNPVTKQNYMFLVNACTFTFIFYLIIINLSRFLYIHLGSCSMCVYDSYNTTIKYECWFCPIMMNVMYLSRHDVIKNTITNMIMNNITLIQEWYYHKDAIVFYFLNGHIVITVGVTAKSSAKIHNAFIQMWLKGSERCILIYVSH